VGSTGRKTDRAVGFNFLVIPTIFLVGAELVSLELAVSDLAMSARLFGLRTVVVFFRRPGSGERALARFGTVRMLWAPSRKLEGDQGLQRIHVLERIVPAPVQQFWFAPLTFPSPRRPVRASGSRG
jgi:hypothetical protein